MEVIGMPTLAILVMPACHILNLAEHAYKYKHTQYIVLILGDWRILRYVIKSSPDRAKWLTQ